MPAIYLQARRNWGAVGLQPSQTFAKFDLLTVDNDSEKKKRKKEKEKNEPVQIPQKLQETLLLSNSFNA